VALCPDRNFKEVEMIIELPSVINLEVIRTTFSALTFFSLIIAFLAFKSSKKKQREDSASSHDKEILSQCIRSLEWSYDSLSIDQITFIPAATRLNWLTSARHIMRYYKLRDSLKTETYKLICEEYEEYWRHKFYKLFQNECFMSGNYFTDNTKPEWPENIEVRSAMVLSMFSQWNTEVVDLIDELDEDSLIEKSAYQGNMGRGIESYMGILNLSRNRD
jgi:hypothetical protein